MADLPPLAVLLLARRPETAHRWAAALGEVAAAVWLSEADIPPGVRPEVVVSDRGADDLTGSFEPGGAIGLVAFGPAAGADAQLPADATDRELALACRLVAEIARLRDQKDAIERVGREAAQLAETDPLTGIANRRAWDRTLDAWLSQPAQRANSWLVIVDLDGFKQVNDRWGMARGDDVLARAAGALAGQLRREDFVARLGGDEFGVLLHGVPEEHLDGVLDRLGQAVAEQATDAATRVTASLGYVALGSIGLEDGSAEQLFAAAESAMRRAKQAGGNRSRA